MRLAIFSSYREKELRIHHKGQHVNGLYYCLACGLPFQEKKPWKRHYKSKEHETFSASNQKEKGQMAKKRRMHCFLCNFTANNPEEYNKHIDNDHIEEEVWDMQWSPNVII